MLQIHFFKTFSPANFVDENMNVYAKHEAFVRKYNTNTFKEDINYGFRRSLWGMKVWALIIIVGCLITHAIIASEKFTTFEMPNTMEWLRLDFLVVISIFWLFMINKEWIKVPTFAYAERLHETLHE